MDNEMSLVLISGLKSSETFVDKRMMREKGINE